MARFNVYRQPGSEQGGRYYLDVQSDLVTTATRWCIPLRAAELGETVMRRAQSTLSIAGVPHVLDTPNVLAVPARLLREPVAPVAPADQAVVEACIEFMLRGY